MRHSHLSRTCLFFAVTLLSACGRSDDPPTNRTDHDAMPTAPRPALPESTPQAQVHLMATQGNTVDGQLLLTVMGDHIRIGGELTGLPHSGEFGFHFHEQGDCSAPDAASAGDHFNPDGQPHGHPGTNDRHAGDLPNLHADEHGVAQVEIDSGAVSLGDGGLYDILGKALVVHALPDDYTSQPAGGSGDRLACGVVSAR